MEAVILLGAPGSGKGTAAEDLVDTTDFIHVSTGNMLREAIASRSAIGLEAEQYMEGGGLVPDEMVMRLVQMRLSQDPPDTKYLFDGFPRTAEQAALLDPLLARYGGKVSHVMLLDVDKELVLQRTLGRRVCRNCFEVFHVTGKPPKRDGICDSCGGEVYRRDDDNEETVLNRLAIYQGLIGELQAYYERKGLLTHIDARDRNETKLSILKALGE